MNQHKPPPLLLGATLLFWGWQSGMLGVGAILAILLEFPRLSKVRWEFSDEEFSRIWTFCTLLLLAGVVYAFTLNEGPSRFAEMFEDPDLRTQSRAGLSSARTAASLVRWLPIIFFLFVAAQNYSSRGGVPLETVSLILRRRWKKSKKNGTPLPKSRAVDISYIYFVVCIFAASIHGEEPKPFFAGASVLLVWALWPLRSPRFNFAVWAGCLAVALSLAFYSQRGLGQLQQYIENMNPQWLSNLNNNRFEAAQSRTSLGRIGRIQNSPQIVIRLEAKDGPPPALLREATYNNFRGDTWYSSGLSRDFERVDEEPPGSNYPLVPGKTNIASVQISCFLPGGRGLLPLPPSVGRVTNLPAFLVEKNPRGAVFAQGPGLVIFEALFGPGPMMDSPASEPVDTYGAEKEERYLDEVIDSLNLRGKTREEVLRALSDYFGEFKYSTYQERVRSRQNRITPLGRFLTSTHSGHCEYFASATVLLLQRLGFPARYAVGYRVHENVSARSYVVRQRDAHAWATVWDPERKIWKDFDTTPPTSDSLAQGGWRLKLYDAWSRLKYEILRIRWGQTRLREYILWIVVPILFVLLGQILFSRRKRVRKKIGGKAQDHWPGMDSEVYELEKKLARRGFPRQNDEPVAEWLLRNVSSLPQLENCRETARDLLRLHYRYRFDPNGLSTEERDRLRANARELANAFAK